MQLVNELLMIQDRNFVVQFSCVTSLSKYRQYVTAGCDVPFTLSFIGFSSFSVVLLFLFVFFCISCTISVLNLCNKWLLRLFTFFPVLSLFLCLQNRGRTFTRRNCFTWRRPLLSLTWSKFWTRLVARTTISVLLCRSFKRISTRHQDQVRPGADCGWRGHWGTSNAQGPSVFQIFCGPIFEKS